MVGSIMVGSIARHLFSWSTRNRLRRIQERLRNIRIRWVSGRPLSPAVQGQLVEFRYLRPTLLEMSEDTTWCIDAFTVGPDSVEMRGWALTPFDRYSPASFALNGEPFAEIDFPRDRADVANVFWYRLGAAASGFFCRMPLVPDHRLDDLFPNGFAELQFCDARTAVPFRAEHGFYIAHPAKNDFPDPGKKRRKRVHGNDDLASFAIQGSSAFAKLELVLNKVCGKGLGDYRRILDWGCGCGRVLRYFRDVPGCEIHGTDIDRDNIEWCEEHLGFARFTVCRNDPPMDYEDQSFDLIFGISVMTHLAEKDRMAWLEELDRVADDGAIVLLSVQGNAALTRTSIRSETLIALRQRGFIDVDVSVSAEDLSPEPRRYIDCFVLEDYIRHRWAEHFDVVDIIPGYIGNVQDLVVLRKKRSN